MRVPRNVRLAAAFLTASTCKASLKSSASLYGRLDLPPWVPYRSLDSTRRLGSATREVFESRQARGLNPGAAGVRGAAPVRLQPVPQPQEPGVPLPLLRR
eukprot:422864-Pyramimonas_sp.AAC.1